MIVGVKCNITSLALSKLNELYWGTKNRDLNDRILENYIENLDCSNIDLEICESNDCINETEIFNCSISINKISSSINENVITFFIADGDLVGNSPPYKYKWTYEEDDFDNSGEIDIDEAVLTVKVGKKLNLLVSLIGVEVTDKYGCKATKNCYLTPTGMQCADSYIVCPNVSGLTVRNKAVRCVGVSGLIVRKKQ
jgi:hypothetical protein